MLSYSARWYKFTLFYIPVPTLLFLSFLAFVSPSHVSSTALVSRSFAYGACLGGLLPTATIADCKLTSGHHININRFFTDWSTSFSSPPEWASAEQGGNKATWITDIFRQLVSSKYSCVVGAYWFYINKETDWRINSSSAALIAYRTAVAPTLTATPPEFLHLDLERVVRSLIP